MKKIFTFLCLCVLCIGNAWGETISLNVDDFGYSGTSYSTKTITKNGVTFTMNNGANNTGLAFKASATLVNTSAIPGDITSIDIYVNKFSSTTSAGFYIYGAATANPNEWTLIYENSGTNGNSTANFTGNSFKYFKIANKSSRAMYVGSITINYNVNTPTKTLTSIAVSGTPTKTEYEAGEEFNPAGLVVTGTYDDESTSEITSGITWNVTPSGALTAGTTSVSVTATVGTITSSEYTVEGLTVNAAKTLIGIEATGTPAEFWKGDAFNHEGIAVTASWDDETETDVTSLCDFSGYDMSVAGNQTVTVTYQGETDTYEITVNTIANTQETAYTVSEAIALIDAGKDLDTEVYVAGKISQIDSYNSTYKSITYWISEDGTTTNQFEVYGGLKSEDNQNGSFESKNDIDLQADVIVYGIIKKFNTTYEFDKNNYLVSYSSSAKKYTIEIDSDIENGAVESDAVEAAAGVEVTLTVIPADGYKLSSLTVTDATGAPVTVIDNKFTMPASAVTVSATFVEKVEYTISWSANGEVYTTTKVYEGDALALPDVDVESVGDYTFCGWIASESYSSESTAPEFIVPANTHPTADATYYAVFAKATSGGEATWDVVTNANDLQAGDIVIISTNIGYKQSMKTAGAISSNFMSCLASTYNSDKTQITSVADGTLEFTLGGNSPDGWTLQNGTNYLGMSGDKKVALSNTSSTWSILISNAVATLSQTYSEKSYSIQYNYNNGNDRFTGYTSSQVAISIYKKTQGVTYSDYCTTVEVPQPSIECETTLELAASESEVETLNVTWTDVEEMDIVLYSDATCEIDFDGNWFVADLNEDNNVEYYASENTETEPRIVYMQLYALDADANVITKVVTVTQAAAQPSTVYASLAELVAAGEPTTEGRDITLTLNDDEITSLTSTSSSRTGIVLTANNREVFVHCTNGIGDKYNTGGFVSGTVSGTWKESFVAENWRWTLELSQTEFANLSCAYPVTINTSGRGTAEARVTSEGSESYNTPATKVNAGAAAGILMTPEEGWEFGSVSFDDSNLAINVNDNTTVAYFTMPAKPVTVTVEFEQVAVEDANVIMTWEGSEESFKVEENGTVTLKESDETLGKLTKLEITENIENVNVNYVRKFGTHNLQPWFVPFDYVVPANSDLTFAEIWNAHVDETGKTDYFEYVIVSDGETIPANTPYLVWLNKNSETKQYEFTSTSTLYKTEPISIDCATTKHKYTFEGTYANVKLMENNFWYVREGQMSYTNNSDLELSPYRWHMLMATKSGDAVDPNTLFGTTSQSIKFHNAFGDDLDDADAISEIKTDAVREGAYDLMGRKVTSLVKGNVYIINGKKTYIR